MLDNTKLDSRISRFAVGATVTALIAFCVNWPMAYVAPVLVVKFLSQPLKSFGLGTALQLVMVIVGAFFVGFLFASIFFPFPLVFIPAQGLVLFCLFYSCYRGMSQIFVTLGLVSFTLLPLLHSSSATLSGTVFTHIVLGGILAIVVTLFVWNVFPHSSVSSVQKKVAPRPMEVPHLFAFRSTIVLLPLSILFISMEWSSEALVLVFAAIFLLTPELSMGKAAGISSLVSTLLGGMSAMAFYYIIVLTPSVLFLAAMLLLVFLLFGAVIFSDSKYARYMPSAATCFLILVGGSMKPDADFESAFFRRLILIFGATLYTVLAQGILQRLFPVPEREDSTQ
ncbi:DUF2955 domain-containing protein [Maridesulfovibrio sp.]|uniref:DUF2955 domain-containing protein n=1 Tax=unclassified Maridesulfovibrio TaxID=2794999 RepID=UPI003B00D892